MKTLFGAVVGNLYGKPEGGAHNPLTPPEQPKEDETLLSPVGLPE